MRTRRQRDNGIDGFVGEHEGGSEANVLRTSFFVKLFDALILIGNGQE